MKKYLQLAAGLVVWLVLCGSSGQLPGGYTPNLQSYSGPLNMTDSAATGGSQGAGSINVSGGYYVNGVAVGGITKDPSLNTGSGVTGLSVTPQQYGAKGNGKTLQDGAMGSGSSTFTSATAAFTSGDTGKLICVAGASATTVTDRGGTRHVELCGTISGFTNSTTVTLSFSNASGGSISSQEFTYATDDSTAFASALTALSTHGGNIWITPGLYGLSTGLTMPTTATVNLLGYGSGNFGVNANTELHWLTKGLSGAGITFTGTVGTEIYETWDTISNLIISAGAGLSAGGTYDGGGHDGIDFLNWYKFNITNVQLLNWASEGIYLDTLASGGANAAGYMRMEGSGVAYSGDEGILIGATGSGFLQNVDLQDDDLQNNWNSGLKVAGPLHTAVFLDNIFQWNNQAAGSGTEVVFANNMYGCTFRGNYLESKATNTYGLGEQPASSGTAQGCSATDNYFLGDASGDQGAYFGFTNFNISNITVANNYFQAFASGKNIGSITTVVNSTFGPNLANNGDVFDQSDVYGTTANQLIRRVGPPVALATLGTCTSTDEGRSDTQTNSTAACSAGATATSSGTTHCQVYCNGSNWVQTGL